MINKIVTAAYSATVLTKLTNIPYAILGGQALTLHGYNRSTQDIDILVNANDIQNIVNILGIQNVHALTIGGVAGNLPDGTEIDLVSPGEDWVEDALSNVQVTTNGKVLSKPFLILTKLWASRGSKDENDILQMIKRMNDVEISQTESILNQYLPNVVDDFTQLVELKDIELTL